MSKQNALARIERGALRVLGDNGRWKARFEIGSESSDRVYRVSFDTAQGCWVCSCMGCIRHGQCKHLTAMGLQGRKHGRDLEWIQHFQLQG